MPEIILNCQNLQCPGPVIQIKRLVEASAPNAFAVIVDNEPALENVTRFLQTHGYEANTEQQDNLWHITARKGSTGARDAGLTAQSAPSNTSSLLQTGEDAKTLVLLISPFFGSGDDSLGTRLMKNFIATLPEMGKSLWRLVLLNGGVSLAAEGSPVLEDLQRLEQMGVDILVCGTCLEHFKLLDKKAVGQTTNMLDVVTSMQLADKVLRV